jgi:RND family efflux transporter MFP subunit
MGFIKKMDRKSILLSIAGLLLVSFLTCAWVFRSIPSKEIVEIKVVKPVKSIVIKKYKAIGKRSFPALIKVAKEADLAFRVGGPIKEFNGLVGQKFKKGEIIARIDPRDFEVRILRLNAALEGAKASISAMIKGARQEDVEALFAKLESSKARLHTSKKQLQRSKKLLSQSFTTQAAHDQVVEHYKLARYAYNASTQNLKKAKSGARVEDVQVAVAKIKQLNADIEAAKNALEDTKLKAPFDGILNKKYMESFETISPGRPIVSLLDFSTVEINTSIPEEMMLKRRSFSNIYAIIDAYPHIKIDSKVSEIGMKTTGNNQSFPLTAVLNVHEGLDIKPGMTATLFVEYGLGDKIKKGYRIPVSALFADIDGNSCAWKVNSNMKVTSVKLTTGPIRGGNIAILDGLSADDRIVTAGARFLMEGQSVRLMEETAK